VNFDKPFSGDDRYWFHLLPTEETADCVTRPSESLLLNNPMIPLELDLFYTHLQIFLSWIPTRSGKWELLPEQFVVIDKNGATEAERIFKALVELYQLSPDSVIFPIPKITYTKGKERNLTTTYLKLPRETLLTRFFELARYSNFVANGTHIIFCSYWLERGDFS
jgi:hypothetical protein